ncbi:MAG: D-glycero-beta-D-manno-heptose-7-phosphate kinase [Candidatus Methylomirabilales bacterium]
MGYETLLSRFQDRHILVLGDLMLDEYLWGEAMRISPEAPVPVVEVKKESLHPGGAANVAANVRALGGLASLVGIVGDDVPAERLLDLLEGLGVKGDGVVVDRGRPTTVKTRVVAGSQHVVRFDRERAEEPREEIVRILVGRVAERLPQADALLISDYAKGVISKTLLQSILPLARGKIVVVDPKVPHFFWYRGVTVIAPNHHEAQAIAGMSFRTDDQAREKDLVRVGTTLLKRVKARALLVTRGEGGMSLFEGDGVLHIPAMAREVYDVTGAGDTVVAALTLALAAGATLREAAILANYAASIVVGKRGTATVTREELAQLIRMSDVGCQVSEGI